MSRSQSRVYTQVFSSDDGNFSGERKVEIDLEALARWMDSAFVIPGTGIRFGLDALIGLFPGLGDTVSSLVSLYILQAARQQGVSRATLARIAANIAIDFALGSLPVLGDVFDVYWKANERNVALLKRHIDVTPAEQLRARRGDRWFMIALSAALVLLLVGCMTVSWLVVLGLGRLLFG